MLIKENELLEIIFNKDKSISIINKEGEIIFQQNLYSFNLNDLKKLGFSETEQINIKSLLEKRKHSYYA